MKIGIIGAGISGLSLAYLLKEKFKTKIELNLFEKNHRPGGWIQSLKKNNFLFELGPRSCRPEGNGIYTLKLIEKLGIGSQIIHADPSSKHRFIFHSNALQEIPSSFFKALSSPLFKGVPTALIKEFFKKKSSLNEESIHAFMTRRFGNHIAETFIDPLVSGIYAGDPCKLSIKSCFPTFYDYEQSYGSILKGMLLSKFKKKGETLSSFVKGHLRKGIFSFKEGMETLPLALEANLKGQISYHAEIQKIKINKQKKPFILLKNGKQHVFDKLFLCLPSDIVYPLLETPIHSLNSIPKTNLAVVSIGFCKKVLTKKGFGYLIPSSQNEQILGMVWDSSVFPEQNYFSEETRLTIMLGGAMNKEVFFKSDQELLTIATNSLKKHLSIHETPSTILLHRMPSSIPQYNLRHDEKVLSAKEEVKKFSPHIFLLGNSYHGISVNDCIAEATQIADSFLINDVCSN